MKSYLELVPLSAKNRKKRNSMTIICIIIAVFMVTGIFSMADSTIQGERVRAVEKHGDLHFNVSNASEETLFKIAEDPEVKVFSRYNAINYNLDQGYFINGKKACICACDEGFTEMILSFKEDSYPKNSDEIVMNTSMTEILGLKEGDSVTLETPEMTKVFKVSGFIDEDDVDVYDACGAFITIEAFNEITAGTDAYKSLQGYYQLKNNRTAMKNIDRIKAEFQLDDDNVGVNTILLAVYGNAASSYIFGFYYVAAFLIIFVIAAGAFMIAGSISSSVSERTSFYGMLRCIGASKKQVMKLVRLEALHWCKTAVPIGVVLGTLGSWTLVAILRNISSEFGQIPMFYVSYIGIGAGVLAGIVTVYLASTAPAKRAAKVSPVAAIAGNGVDNGKRRGVKNLEGKPERKLGSAFALEEKKSLFLISGSFALCIVVLLMFVSMLQLVHEALPCLRDYAADMEVYVENYSEGIDKNVVAELSDMKEVKNAFGRMYSQSDVTGSEKIAKADIVSYDQLQFDWAKSDREKGDLKKAISEKGYVASVFDKSNPLEVGDRFTVNGIEVEVAAILGDSPFSSSDIPTIICSEENFEMLFEESSYRVVDIQLNKEYMDMNQSVIRDKFVSSATLSDRRQSNWETRGTYYVFNVIVYAFIFLLALIAMINIINSIAMSTQARIKQFGIMRAIGLDDGELKTMISAQGATYAALGIAAGLVLGLPIHRLSYTLLITRHFGLAWSIPFGAIIAIVAVIAFATLLAVALPVKRIKSVPVTEVIGNL